MARWLLTKMAAPEDRRFMLDDLADEFSERTLVRPWRARWWYRWQVAASLPHCVGFRVQRTLKAGLQGAAQDVRIGARTLRRTPWTALSTVVSLGLGIGAVTAVFTVGNAFLFSGGTSPDGSELVSVFTSGQEGDPYQQTSLPDFETLQQSAQTLEDIAAVRVGIVAAGSGDHQQRLMVELVTHSYLPMVAAPAIGRFFAPEETIIGSAAPVTVLSHRYWQEHYGGQPSVLGQTLRMDGRDHTIIGVAPEGLVSRMLRMKIDVWIPIGLPGGTYHSTPEEWTDRRDREYLVLGRLADGLTQEAAQAELDVVADRLHDEFPEAWTDDNDQARRFTVLPEAEARLPPSARAGMAGATALLLLGTLLVLVIACSNVAGLFIARGARRTRELAVRSAMGASRVRLLRLLIVESLMLALVGGALGLALAVRTGQMLSSFRLPMDIPLQFDVAVDSRVVGFAFLVSVVSAVFFGLLPALRATRIDLVPVLKGGADGSSRRRGWARRGLVLVQVAGATVLVSFAGLFLRTLADAASAEYRVSAQDLAVASVQLSGEEYERSTTPGVLGQIGERITAEPSVATLAFAGVLDGSIWESAFSTRVSTPEATEPDARTTVRFNPVSPGYLELLGVAPVRGRLIETQDREGAPFVVVVNQTMARMLWPEQDPVGRVLSIEESRFFDQVQDSVARTAIVVGLIDDLESSTYGAPPEARFWASFDQSPAHIAVFLARGVGSMGPTVAALREHTQEFNDVLVMVPPQSVEQLLDFRLAVPKLTSLLLGVAGTFTLLLAVVGINGIVSSAAAQRVREMAIRRSIGATGSHVLRVILQEGLSAAMVGLAVGLLVTVLGSALLKGAVGGLVGPDPLALAGALFVLLLAVVAAGFVPALRARSIEPMRALREE